MVLRHPGLKAGIQISFFLPCIVARLDPGLRRGTDLGLVRRLSVLAIVFWGTRLSLRLGRPRRRASSKARTASTNLSTEIGLET